MVYKIKPNFNFQLYQNGLLTHGKRQHLPLLFFSIININNLGRICLIWLIDWLIDWLLFNVKCARCQVFLNMCNSLLELEVSGKCLKNTMLLSRKNQITASPYNSRLFCVLPHYLAKQIFVMHCLWTILPSNTYYSIYLFYFFQS
jgi:hypothetical protein